MTNHHTFVVNVFYDDETQTWFATVAKDAIRRFQTERFDTKKEAIKGAARLITESTL